MKKFLHIFLYVLLLCPLFIHTTRVVINNLQPRFDINGTIIDAHDGSIQQFEKHGLYYMHAMQYGLCKEPPKYGCDGVSLFLCSRNVKRTSLYKFRLECQVDVAFK